MIYTVQVTELTPELMDEYVESVEVIDGEEVRITWKDNICGHPAVPVAEFSERQWANSQITSQCIQTKISG